MSLALAQSTRLSMQVISAPFRHLECLVLQIARQHRCGDPWFATQFSASIVVQKVPLIGVFGGTAHASGCRTWGLTAVPVAPIQIEKLRIFRTMFLGLA